MSAIQIDTIEYKDGDTTLEGCVVYDKSSQAKRPGVLIVHQWFGITGHEKSRAEMLAKLGYVAFCADIYGKGVRPKTV
ncbi:MAG TPA: dienelactone hydrolase family protein, partial [Desulfuromonadaceae bacterium]|nr:dienelactone hydrolase family protein [Desulfuromonadaceae bacterium]